MGAYLFRRVIRAVVVVAGVSFISFAVLFLSGDPTDTMVGEDWTVQEVKQLRQDMGLDKPWFVQYGRYVGRAVQGDFGESLRYRQPAFELIMERLPATLETRPRGARSIDYPGVSVRSRQRDAARFSV